MSSPTPSESTMSQLYNQFFVENGDTSDEDLEEEAVTSTCEAIAKYLKRSPPRGVTQRQYIERDRSAANERLMKDYFVDTPTYANPKIFRRRFRMHKGLFLRIAGDLEREFDYFKQKPDGRGCMGFTAIQKCTSALRILAYGNTTDINDEYLKMAEKTSRDTLEHFCYGIIRLYKDRYLRKPTWSDLQQIYQVHEQKHGFPGMIGSIDCRHWQWYNCPIAWKGQHTRGDQKGPTLILQAVASHDLWIWSAYFGAVGSLNDINVLEQSSVIEDFISGNAPVASFWANDTYYRHGYFLGDGIYPEYSCFVKTFRDPIDEKRVYFKKRQESARKDVERLFGVLQQRWHFIRNPCRLWSKEKIRTVMYACLILHNMILEDDGRAKCQNYNPEDVHQVTQATMEERVQNAHLLRSREIHNSLKADLVQHLWRNRNIHYDDDDNENDELEDEENDEFEDEEEGEDENDV